MLEKVKKFFFDLFIDGLSGMATGLFCTLIVGTIIKQIGSFIPGDIGALIVTVGSVAQILTGAGIGCGVAAKFKSSPLVTVSAAVCGLAGAYAGKIITGSLVVSGIVTLQGPGEPLGAFIAAYVGIKIGNLIFGKTKVDILIVPLVSISAGATVGLVLGPPISDFMTWLGSLVNWGTTQAPFLMGIVVSVLMGIFLTLPISSAAIGVILKLNGIAAGAAVVGCCCNMVGFAVASYRENKVGGLIAQGVGTSMLQMPNIVRHPIIWLPAIISSAILGPVSTCLLGMVSTPTGSGMGSAGLVGQIETYFAMSESIDPVLTVIEIVIMQFVLPAAISLIVSEAMRKLDLIKKDYMRLSV